MKTTILSFALMLILSIFVSTLLPAQGTLKGTVIDSLTEEPVPFANVYVKYGDNLIGAQTALDGSFTIKPIPSGTYNLYVSFVGYGDKIITDIAIKNDKITFQNNIALTYGTDLPPVVIAGEKALVDPEEVSGQTLDNLVLRSIPDNSNINKIAAISGSDIQVSDDDSEIYFRGSRSGDALYIIDGMRMINPQAFCPGLAIGNMTVYTGGVPAKYGDFTGGVIVIETQSYFDWLAQQESERLRNGGN
jgi:hypothetical protein